MNGLVAFSICAMLCNQYLYLVSKHFSSPQREVLHPLNSYSPFPPPPNSLLFVVHSAMSHSFRPHGLKYTRLPCPSLSPWVCSNSCSMSWWCHSTISSSVTPFSSSPQSFPASGSFPISWLFASGGQGIGASASASVLLMNIQNWFPLGWTGWISLKSKGLFKSLLFPKAPGSPSSASCLCGGKYLGCFV